MKKFLLIFALTFVLVGCSFGMMENTPTQKVEDYLSKYQRLDKSVMDDLDVTLQAEDTLDDDDREDYKEFMKKHYQDLEYEIKDETIDGDNATVIAEVTVRNYTDAVSKADIYKKSNEDAFNDESGDYDPSLFSSYRLEELKKVTDTATYTITFTLIKQNDKWVLNQLSDEDLNKINGLYAG